MWSITSTRSSSFGLRRLLFWLRCAALVLAIAVAVGVYRGASGSAASPLASASFELKREGFSGAVQSMFPAGQYTYFNLRLANGTSRWIVALDREHRAAAWLDVNSYGLRRRFKSARLGRIFDEVYFVSVRASN